jgi:hypothetical protein
MEEEPDENQTPVIHKRSNTDPCDNARTIWLYGRLGSNIADSATTRLFIYGIGL